MLAISASFLAALVVPFVSAVPLGPGFPGSGFKPGFPGAPSFAAPQLTGCSVTNAKLTLPSTAPAAGMAIPATEKPVFVALGRGVQNYTCAGGVYGTNQAVAQLFDASCAVGTPLLTQLPKLALAAPKGPKLPSGCSGAIGSLKLGDHYFQKLSANATTSNPVFDFRATKKGDFVALKKDTSVSDPTSATKNVAWVQLSAVQGTAANHVFRVNTAGGVAPTSCTTDGEVKTVEYAALYWFYK